MQPSTVAVKTSSPETGRQGRRSTRIAPVAVGAIFGFGVHSYVLGLEAMLKLLRK